MTTLIALLVAALVIYLVYSHLNKVTDDTLPAKEEAPLVEPVVAKVEEAVAEEPKKERKKRAPSAKSAGKKSAKN